MLWGKDRKGRRPERAARAILVALAALLPIILLGFACGDGEGEPSTPATTPEASPTSTPTTPTPTLEPLPSPTVTGQPLPEAFPSDFPIYPNAIVVSGYQQGSSITAVFRTPDLQGQVLAFYQQALREDPWTIVNVSEGEVANFIAFSRPDDQSLSGTLVIRALQSDGEATQMIIFLPKAGSTGEDEEGSP